MVRTPEGRYRISSKYDHGDKEVCPVLSCPVLSDVRVEGNTFTWSYLIPSTGWRKTITATRREGGQIFFHRASQHRSNNAFMKKVD